jgi:hypothetical protein
VLQSISITDLDLRGRISLYGYLHALWSTKIVRFLTNAYNQHKTLKWSASINHAATSSVDELKVRSHVGKTNFSVNVDHNTEPSCSMTGSWMQSSFEHSEMSESTSPTRIAPFFHMRSMSDAIRSVSIIHGMLFGGMTHQLELATDTVVLISAISYDMYTVRTNVDLYPHISLLDVVHDTQFRVRLLYYDSNGTLFMSATGTWISVDKTTSKSKPLPKPTMALFRQFFYE